MFEWHKKEAPVFTGVTRGVGGFGFGSKRAATATAAGSGRDGLTSATAALTVQELYDNGQSSDGLYFFNLGGTVYKLFAPLNSHPYYIVIGNYGGAANAFLSNASSLTGNNLNDTGTTTSTGNFASDDTYGYYRNHSSESANYKYATLNNYGFSWRYVKFRFNLYNYYSNDGFNSGVTASELGLSSGIGDGVTLARNNSGDGTGQHIFTYLSAINSGDNNSCPSSGGTSPTTNQSATNAPAYMGNNYSCFTRSNSGFNTEFVRNFTVQSGDNSGVSPSVLSGDSYFTIDTGSTRTHGINVIISSDQSSSNEDTYIKRALVMVKA